MNNVPLFTHKERSLFSGTSQCLVCPSGSSRRAFTAYKNREVVAFTANLFSSSLTQFTDHPTLPTPTATSEAGLLKPTHPVDTRHLQTRKSACIFSFGAIRNMSGNAGVGQQPCFNTGASMSVNSSAISTSSTSKLQSFSHSISLGSAGPISLVLSTPAQAPASSPVSSTTAPSGLTVPTVSQSLTQPQTPEIQGMTKASTTVPPLDLDQTSTSSDTSLLTAPELKGMTKATPVPALDLDQTSTSSSTTSLVTASPYTLNETTTFTTGTSLWQSSSSSTRTAQSPSSIITSNPYTTNETTVFPYSTSLRQSASAKNSTTPQQTLMQTTSQAPTEASSSLITSSPFTQNEGMTFLPGTQMWQSSSSQTSSQTPSQSHTSLITASPYAQNEGVTFSAGTAFWQPLTTPTAAAAATNPHAQACSVASSALSSIRPMSAPLPASNVITVSPYARNEGVTFSSGTSFWSSSANTLAFATNRSSSSGETSLVTSSPYAQNEGMVFPAGTQMYQPKQ